MFSRTPQFTCALLSYVTAIPILSPHVHTVLAYGPTLLQCMSIQGLDTFLSLYRTAKPVCPLLRLLKIDGAPYTVFAPNDSAFEAISDQLETLTPADVCRLLLRHIVSGSLDSSQLLNGMRLTSFAGTRLFVAAVQHYIPVDENREIVENVRTHVLLICRGVYKGVYIA